MREETAFLFCATVVLVAYVRSGSAQEINASIRVTVNDASEAAVSRAEVRATNRATRITTIVPTENDGSFAFLQLLVGAYDVSVSNDGFQTFTARNVAITLNAIYKLPVKLDVGQVTETHHVKEIKPCRENLRKLFG